MLPTLVPWENGGWLYYPYSELGDHGFYSSAKYTVTIRSSSAERLVVGGTGSVQSVNDAGTEWKFIAENVRDVAYILSPRFIDPLKDATMTRTVGNTRMLAYFTPEHRATGQRQLDLTAPALAWFAEKVGPYPFDTYTVAEMGVPQLRSDNYAQEYPMSYSIPSPWLSLGTSPPSWTWYIPVHEVGHQWFYSLIGSNQLADPWLDEGLTTYMTAEYVRDRFPQHYRAAWAAMSGGADRSRPVSSGVFSDFRSEQHYGSVVYDGGAQMLDRVRTTMGDASFYAALRDYYTQTRFQRATPFQFTSIFQKHAETELGPIFSEYLGY
jgi:aminopeptidase N